MHAYEKNIKNKKTVYVNHHTFRNTHICNTTWTCIKLENVRKTNLNYKNVNLTFWSFSTFKLFSVFFFITFYIYIIMRVTFMKEKFTEKIYEGIWCQRLQIIQFKITQVASVVKLLPNHIWRRKKAL